MFSFVCIPTDWKCLKTELIRCQREKSNDAEEKLTSTLTRYPKLFPSDSQMAIVYLGNLCGTLKETHCCFCCTPARERPSDSDQEETSGNPMFKNWPLSINSISFIKGKERFQNCSQWKETTEAWQLNAICDQIKLQGKRAYKGCYQDNWQPLNVEGKIGKNTVSMQNFLNFILNCG